MNRKKYVYQLVNEQNIIEYIGEAFDPERRFKEHKKNTTKSGMGKFKGRTDLKLEVIAEFDNTKDAYDYQCGLQKIYFGTSDKEQAKINGLKGGQYGYLGWIERKKRAGIK